MKTRLQMLKQKIIETYLFNYISAQLHFIKRRRELKKIVRSLIDKYRMKPMEEETLNCEISDYVWVCWWQGENDMSPIVRKCYNQIKELNTNKQVILITEENVNKYVTFPSFIIEKYHKGIITKTHLSDILRAELLCKYGGVWMDITLITWTRIPDSFFEFPFYTGHFAYDKYDFNISRNRWTSFFLVARSPNNVLFQYLTDFWRLYWRQKDCLIEYLLVDYAIDFGYKYISSIRKEIDLVPINGCGNNVWQLLKILPNQFKDEVIEKIKKENWMQKLSYRGENKIQEKSNSPENSIYKKLFLD